MPFAIPNTTNTSRAILQLLDVNGRLWQLYIDNGDTNIAIALLKFILDLASSDGVNDAEKSEVSCSVTMEWFLQLTYLHQKF